MPTPPLHAKVRDKGGIVIKDETRVKGGVGGQDPLAIWECQEFWNLEKNRSDWPGTCEGSAPRGGRRRAGSGPECGGRLLLPDLPWDVPLERVGAAIV